MPLITVTRNGERCYKWGDSGTVYCGKGAREKALAQARAILANEYKEKKKPNSK